MRSAIPVVVATIAASAIVGHASAPPQRRLTAFKSDAELRSFLQSFAEEQKKAMPVRVGGALPMGVPVAASAPPPQPGAAAGFAAGMAADSITNVQHAGVDEGGIVKLRGEHLVILRRGRLFTVRLGQNELAPTSAVDAFGPDIDPRGTWYDELLVSGDKVVVIGYSYARGGTEVGLFDLDGGGQLHYRSTYHLRSNDYYSSRNYSSRLIGTKLVFYTPLYLRPEQDLPQLLPAIRKWRRGATPGEFTRIAAATRIYRPAAPLNPRSGAALHTLTTCELARVELECEATGILGPAGRVFYVSPRSVYVWTTDSGRGDDSARPRSMLYALPLDGSAPSALQVAGSPVDQFSFLESGDEHLNVLLRRNGRGDGMWAAERSRGAVALLRVPLSSFGDGTVPVAESHYRGLPAPVGYAFHNRFVGDYVLYGTGNGWGPPRTGDSQLRAVPWKGGGVFELKLPHGVDRIEPVGPHAAVIGIDGRNLHFTTVNLGRDPSIAGRYVREQAAQGELRSHGFFYKPESDTGGMLGLPIRRGGSPGYAHLVRDSASILFLRSDDLRLREVGELGAEGARVKDDACRASCVDWYGNARPLFIAGRVFALLGYEIVEGRFRGGGLEEARRVNYSPQSRGTM
jgi:Beta propeller domain